MLKLYFIFLYHDNYKQFIGSVCKGIEHTLKDGILTIVLEGNTTVYFHNVDSIEVETQYEAEYMTLTSYNVIINSSLPSMYANEIPF